MAVYRFYEYGAAVGTGHHMEGWLLDVAKAWNAIDASCEAKVLLSAELGSDKKFLVSKHASEIEALQFWLDWCESPKRLNVQDKWKAKFEGIYLKLFSFYEIEDA